MRQYRRTVRLWLGPPRVEREGLVTFNLPADGAFAWVRLSETVGVHAALAGVDLGRDYDLLSGSGDARECWATDRHRQAIQSVTGERTQGDTLGSLLLDLVTRRSESGAPRPRQLPTTRNELRFSCGVPLCVRQFAWGTDDYTDTVIGEDRGYLRDVAAVSPKKARQCLAGRKRKYGLPDDWRERLSVADQAELAALAPTDDDLEDPESSDSDNFNRADGPLSPSWESNGYYSIIGNQAARTSGQGANSVQREIDMSSDDLEGIARAINQNSQNSRLGPAVRCVAGTTDNKNHSVVCEFWNGDRGQCRLLTVTGRFSIDIQVTSSFLPYVAHCDCKVQINGNTLTGFHQAAGESVYTQFGEVTASTNLAGTIRGGLASGGSSTAGRVDDYALTDILTETIVPIGYGQMALQGVAVTGAKRAAVGSGAYSLGGMAVSGAKRAPIGYGQMALQGVAVTAQQNPRPFYSLSCPSVPRSISASHCRRAVSVPFNTTAISAE